MKKYVWKCERQNCANEFKAENPDQCPECGGDDIMIIDESGIPPMSDNIKKILIASLGIVAIGLVWMNWDKIISANDVTGVEGPHGNITYSLNTVEYDNYFEIDGVEIDDIGLYVINSLSGDKVYSEGNEFYPCEDGNFTIKWEKQNNVEIKGKNKIKNFKLDKDAHENACVKQLEIIDVDVRTSDCNYSIMTNMDDNANLEVSLKNKNGFVKGKLVWKLSEINGADYFYVRLKDSDQIDKIKIPSCIVPKAKKSASSSEVVASFNLYISDIKNNRTQFTEFLKKENSASVIIVYKGEEMQLMDFIMQIRTTERNDGAIFLQSLRLNESNVFYNSEKTKIIKLKITK